MGQKAVLCCEDSQEGIFTAVYDGWAGRYGHENVRLQVREEEDRELFSSYINVRTDAGKARKVSDTVRRRMGGRAYLDIARAALSWEADKGTAIYHTIVRGLSMADGFRVMQVLTDPYVCRVSALARAVAREADHLMGFARFSQLPGGVLYARIRPRNRVLPAIAPHFQDRLPGIGVHQQHGLAVQLRRGDRALALCGGGGRRSQGQRQNQSQKKREKTACFHIKLL